MRKNKEMSWGTFSGAFVRLLILISVLMPKYSRIPGAQEASEAGKCRPQPLWKGHVGWQEGKDSEEEKSVV